MYAKFTLHYIQKAGCLYNKACSCVNTLSPEMVSMFMKCIVVLLFTTLLFQLYAVEINVDVNAGRKSIGTEGFL